MSTYQRQTYTNLLQPPRTLLVARRRTPRQTVSKVDFSKMWSNTILKRDYSEDTGLPPTDVYRRVRVLTFEPGGQPDVRSRCIPPRPERRDHGARSPAAARERPGASHRPTATVSALWSRGLSGHAVAADAARLGPSRRVVSAGSARPVCAAFLDEGAPILARRPLCSGPTGPSRPARGHLGRDHRVCGPGATLHNGGEAGGKKGAGAPGHGVPGLGLGGCFGGCRRRCTRGRARRYARRGRSAR